MTARTFSAVPDRDRALVDDDLVAVHRPADLAGDRHDVLQIGGAILALRRPDGDEHDLRGLDRPRPAAVVNVSRPFGGVAA